LKKLGLVNLITSEQFMLTNKDGEMAVKKLLMSYHNR